jgi:hypothetical protein
MRYRWRRGRSGWERRRYDYVKRAPQSGTPSAAEFIHDSALASDHWRRCNFKALLTAYARRSRSDGWVNADRQEDNADLDRANLVKAFQQLGEAEGQ